MQETWVPSLDPEDPLEEGMATHSSILAYRIPGREEPGGLQSRGSHSSLHTVVPNLGYQWNHLRSFKTY